MFANILGLSVCAKYAYRRAQATIMKYKYFGPDRSQWTKEDVNICLWLRLFKAVNKKTWYTQLLLDLEKVFLVEGKLQKSCQ